MESLTEWLAKRETDNNLYLQIKDLEEEYSVEALSDSVADKLRSCWQQIRPLFVQPNIFKLIAIGLIQLGATIGSDEYIFFKKKNFILLTF